MIVNSDKFQVIIIGKKKGYHTNENVVIDNKQIKTVLSVELLGIQMINWILAHISILAHICKSAANQLNALIRLQKFLKVHYCRSENLPIRSNLYKNNTLKNSHF